jgi:exopolyphosphatase/guanosine-5'-triphosphate,3'-diphosphate pyrophosphatase
MPQRALNVVLWRRHHDAVPVGVIDVGSNTVRLLVTEDGSPVLSRREMLRLGADVELHGSIPPDKLRRAAEVVRDFADAARNYGADLLEILITSPGRQASNGDELLAALADAGRCDACVLSAAEEGRLAFIGAIKAASPPSRRPVAVIDVGGGSAQVVVGSHRDGVQWTRSIDLGSQRLTSRALSADPPGETAIATARAEVERYLEDFDPPPARTVYAVGGSARALKRIGGSRLDIDELDAALDVLARTPTAELVRRHGIDPERVRTLAAGAVILSALQHHLVAPLKVVRGGLREGALSELGARRAAA